MINPVLSRRRIPVIVRREDLIPTARGHRASSTGTSTRRGTRRAPRRGLRMGDEGTRSVLIAVAVLLAASVAWIGTFVYLASLG